MGRIIEGGEMTIYPGINCETGDILNVNWLGHNGRIKITHVERLDHGTTFRWIETEKLTRRERRKKNNVTEKYYLKFAKRLSR